MKKDELNERHKAFNRWWKANYRALHVDRLPPNQQDRFRCLCLAAYRAGWHDAMQEYVEPVAVGGAR